MKKISNIMFAIAVLVFTPLALANTSSNPRTQISWDEVKLRIDETPVTGQISYRVDMNGESYTTSSTSMTLEGHPRSGSDICVYTIETQSSLSRISAPNCITIDAKPAAPAFKWLQMMP